MLDTVESLQRTEGRILALFRNMDAGEDAICIFKDTPTQTVAPAAPPRFPRYMSDFLRARCGKEAILDVQGPRADRAKAEQCIAAAHEKEPLTLFAKHCRRGCDLAAIQVLVKTRLERSFPSAKPQPPAASLPRRIY